jgi:pterin-4a-carbinolamine dehydratase
MATKKQPAQRKALAKPGGPFVFISYRRVDSAAAARWLYSAIQRTFGPSSVFMDTEAIRVSAEWPKAIERGLQQATHLIAVVGPHWLRVADDYGRRRIDRDDDWVHKEIAHALLKGKRILPIVLARGGMPRADALPSALQKLASIQPFELRDDRWDSDLNLLMQELEGQGFQRATVSPVRYPKPRITITEIAQEQFAEILQSLPGWTEEVSPLPGREPLKRIELRKAFEFESFERALEFMREVSEPVVRAQHHPRWENIWRTVTIWLSTWDIGQKPSQLDVDLAHEIERIYKKYEGARSRGPAS